MLGFHMYGIIVRKHILFILYRLKSLSSLVLGSKIWMGSAVIVFQWKFRNVCIVNNICNRFTFSDCHAVKKNIIPKLYTLFLLADWLERLEFYDGQ
jgi:hypothetical protein